MFISSEHVSVSIKHDSTSDEFLQTNEREKVYEYFQQEKSDERKTFILYNTNYLFYFALANVIANTMMQSATLE